MNQEQHFTEYRDTQIFLKRIKLFLASVLLLDVAALGGMFGLFLITSNTIFLLLVLPLAIVEMVGTTHVFTTIPNKLATRWRERKK